MVGEERGAWKRSCVDEFGRETTRTVGGSGDRRRRRTFLRPISRKGGSETMASVEWGLGVRTRASRSGRHWTEKTHIPTVPTADSQTAGRVWMSPLRTERRRSHARRCHAPTRYLPRAAAGAARRALFPRAGRRRASIRARAGVRRGRMTGFHDNDIEPGVAGHRARQRGGCPRRRRRRSVLRDDARGGQTRTAVLAHEFYNQEIIDVLVHHGADWAARDRGQATRSDDPSAPDDVRGAPLSTTRRSTNTSWTTTTTFTSPRVPLTMR